MKTGRRVGIQNKTLTDHVNSCKTYFSTNSVDDIVNYLRKTYPHQYRRKKHHALTWHVQQIVQQQQNPKKRTKTETSSTSSPSPQRKKKYKRNYDSESSTTFVSAPTSEEEEEEEEVEEEKFDVIQSSLREAYRNLNQQTQKKIVDDMKCDHGNVSNVRKNIKIVDIFNGVAASSDQERKECGDGGSVELGEEGGPRFKDLGGMQRVLESLESDVFFPFSNPHVLKRIGVKPRRGILLHGPPGCGKTKLAHAIANEMGFPFYKISATEIVSKISGESEENIRDLFSKAYKTAPSIIFIDEIDAIASKRENAQRESEKRIVTQLMTCMDEYHKMVQPAGYADSNSETCNHRPAGNILVIGATNRPDAIDPALRRPGRFDREIRLGIPDEKARAEILLVLTRKCSLEGSIDVEQLAKSTPGFVGADLDALVDKAGTLAVERIAHQTQSDLSREPKHLQHNQPWWKIALQPADIENLAITISDFEEAAKVIQPSLRREAFSSIPNVKWEDVGGLDSVRKEFDLYLIRRIRNPKLYQKFGMESLETGFLLYGPPGCGKTLIAKAVATEAGVPFIHIKGPELLTKYVGESEKEVRTLFHRARACSPCLLFFDEVDSLTTSRGGEGGQVVDRILNQLLIELDDRPDVYVIGATNRPEVMDPAVLRPGRFGKHISIPLPSPDERGLILKALAKGKCIDASVDLSAIGRMKACENFCGADLKNLAGIDFFEAVKKNIYAENECTIKTIHFEAASENFSDEIESTIKTIHFEQALSKISPSLSAEQIQNYQTWSKNFKAT